MRCCIGFSSWSWPPLQLAPGESRYCHEAL
jgi:hypothetical protein